jgi:hypothetical protein
MLSVVLLNVVAPSTDNLVNVYNVYRD